MIRKLLYIGCLFNSFSISSLINDSWQCSYYVGSYGFASITNKGIPKNPLEFFKTESYFNIEDFKDVCIGDIVRIMPRFVLQFYQEVLPTIRNPIVLLISGGDESFPSDCNMEGMIDDLLRNEKIIHIFAQNCDYSGSSKKVSHYPIGMDFHSIAYKNKQGLWGEIGSTAAQENQLNRILKKLKPTYQRKIKAFVDFQWSDTMHGQFNRYLQFGEDRTSIFNQLLQTGLIDHGPRMRRSSLWTKKGSYAFSISPPGNGLDCHRTWEDLVLGCIVIVKTSALDKLYENLPVVIVNDWSDITQENLNFWVEKYHDAFTNPEYRKRLSNEYWLKKIIAASDLNN